MNKCVFEQYEDKCKALIEKNCDGCRFYKDSKDWCLAHLESTIYGRHVGVARKEKLNGN